MDVAQLVLEYVRVLIWPLVVVGAILVVRPHLSGLVKRMNQARLSFRDWSFDVGLEAARERVEAIEANDPAAPDATAKAQAYVDGQLRRFLDDEQLPSAWADMPPGHAVIVRAYMAMIDAVHHAAELLGVSWLGTKEAQKVGSHPLETRSLVDKGVIDFETEQSIKALDWTYEQAARNPDSVDPKSAAMFRRLSEVAALHVLEKAYAKAADEEAKAAPGRD